MTGALKKTTLAAGQHRAGGQALVELSLVLVACLTLLVGVADLGRAFAMAVAVQGGVGAAAHLGSEQVGAGVTDQAVIQRLIDSSRPFLDGCTPPAPSGSNPYPYAPVTCTSSGGTWTLTVTYSPAVVSPAVPSPGSNIEVKAVGLVPPIVGLTKLASTVGLGQITVQGDANWIVQ